MESVPPKPSLELAEIEGHSRTRVVLYGRAVPRAEQPPESGIEGRAEDAFFHGVAEGRTEPLGLGYPDLVVRGEWKQLHLQTGDARAVATPARAPWPRPGAKFEIKLDVRNDNPDRIVRRVFDEIGKVATRPITSAWAPPSKAL